MLVGLEMSSIAFLRMAITGTLAPHCMIFNVICCLVLDNDGDQTKSHKRDTVLAE